MERPFGDPTGRVESETMTGAAHLLAVACGYHRVMTGRHFARTDQNPFFREDPSRPVTGGP
jgi:hypothetical protein